MKLRQKLALVLASAMIVSAVPVVTMAASTNALSTETIKVAENTPFMQVATANAVVVRFDDAPVGENTNKEVFYLNLENAEFNADAIEAEVAASNFKVKKQLK